MVWQKGGVELLAEFNDDTFNGNKQKAAKAGGQTSYTIAAGLIICSILSLLLGIMP